MLFKSPILSRTQPSAIGAPPSSDSSSGFSLVEVVLAIGVVAFAFVAILGMVPLGLGIFSAALDTSVHSQIVQRFVSDAQQTDFDTLLAQTPPVRYFDDEGSETKTPSIYIATMTVKPTTALPKTAVSSNLATLSIKIAKDPAHSGNLSATSKLHIWNDVAFVARSNTATYN